jgi:hypothetical protein
VRECAPISDAKNGKSGARECASDDSDSSQFVEEKERKKASSSCLDGPDPCSLLASFVFFLVAIYELTLAHFSKRLVLTAKLPLLDLLGALISNTWRAISKFLVQFHALG